jgi:type IV fimbrial biogenesis protein FimT
MLAFTHKQKSFQSRHSNMPGYSLTELLVTLAVMGILAAQAAPAFQQTIGIAKQRAYSNALQDAIRLARQAAANEGSTITVCPLADNEACGNDWSLGWVVLRSETGVSDAVALTIRKKRITDPQIKITANRSQFSFEPSGRSSNGTVLLCASGSGQPSAVIVSYTGKSRVSQQTIEGASACA